MYAHGDSCEYTLLTGFPLSTKYPVFRGEFSQYFPLHQLRLQGWYFITGLLFIVLLFFGYALWVIIRQRQLTDIQKIFINN